MSHTAFEGPAWQADVYTRVIAMTNNAESRSGLAYGIIANVLWGLLPLYLDLLKGVDALQVLSHRVVWSLIALGLMLHWVGRVRATFAAAKCRTLGLLAVSAAFIAVNWFVYIWSAAEKHLVGASIGYFIIPLVSVALCATFLGERLTWRQALAAGVSGFGVLILICCGGSAIWI